MMQRRRYKKLWFIFCFGSIFPIFFFIPHTLGQQQIAIEDLRDPFRPPALPEEVEEEIEIEEIPTPELPVFLPEFRFNIEGLVWGTPRPQVIVDGKILTIGDILPIGDTIEDTIEGGKIISISKSGIEIIYEGRTFSFPSPGRKSLEQKEKRW